MKNKFLLFSLSSFLLFSCSPQGVADNNGMINSPSENGGGEANEKDDLIETSGLDDLITLFKAQTQGFYIINVFNKIEKVRLSEWRFNLIKKEVHRVQRNKHLLFADYGKTWALTKEELENE